MSNSDWYSGYDSARNILALAVITTVLVGCSSSPQIATEDTRTILVERDRDGDGNIDIWTVELGLAAQDTVSQPSNSELCWAACVLTIRMHTGEDTARVTMESLRDEFIVTLPPELQDADVPREAAEEIEIMSALAPRMRDQMRGRLVVDQGVRQADRVLLGSSSMTETQVINSLLAGEPVIIGILTGLHSGHAMLVHKATFERGDAIDAARPIAVRVVDDRDRVQAPSAEREYQILRSQDHKGWSNWLTSRKASLLGAFGLDEQGPWRIREIVVFDPMHDAHATGNVDGDAFSRSEFQSLVYFALNRPFSETQWNERREWVEKHDLGPGFYVRNPIKRNEKPVLTTAVGGVETH